MSQTVTEEYTDSNGWVRQLGHDNRGPFVRCWQPEEDGGTLWWEERGTVIKEENNVQTIRPYTSEEAKASYDKWNRNHP